MSPIQFYPTNVINFASSLSPIFITTFLVLDGAFNGNIKFLFYLVGLFFALLLGVLLRGSSKVRFMGIDDAEKAFNIDNYIKKCLTFDGPFNMTYDLRDGPSSHAIFHSFTIMYFLQSIINNPYDIGWPFLFLLIIIASIDIMVKKKYNCNTISNFVKGGVLGVVISAAWWQILANTSWPGKQNLYYGTEDTMKKCRFKGKTKFKCSPVKLTPYQQEQQK